MGRGRELRTVFRIRPNRNRAAFDDLVGPAPGVGVPTTDRFPVYAHLSGDKRQVCWAHPRRDFQAMIDRDGGGSVIGDELSAHADISCAHWRKVRDGTGTRRWFERTHTGWLRVEVRVRLGRGTVCGCAKTAVVCRDTCWLAVESSLWTFAAEDKVHVVRSGMNLLLWHLSQLSAVRLKRTMSVQACRSSARKARAFVR